MAVKSCLFSGWLVLFLLYVAKSQNEVEFIDRDSCQFLSDLMANMIAKIKVSHSTTKSRLFSVARSC